MSQPPREQQIFSRFSDTGLTVACAESCTGGLVAWRITSVAGSSEYFLGSVVAYSNHLKEQVLGVSRQTLDLRGAVSEACAREMAEGVRDLSGASIAVSTTGIAGPGGATDRKPVGLIYIGCATNQETTVRELRLPGDRSQNMAEATEIALQLILEAADNQPDRQ